MSFLTHSNGSLPSFESERKVAYAFDLRQPLLLLHLVYTIPSFIAYYKCRMFLANASGYFNVIFTNDFYINVALFIVDFLFSRLPLSGLFVNLPEYVPSGLPLTVIYFLSYYLIYANFYSITVICFNRMSSVVFPYSCNWFWQRFVGVTIALIYILPLATTWQILTYEAYFLPLYEQRSNYQLVYRYKIQLGFLIRSSTALSVVSAFLSVICIIANGMTILRYKKAIQTVAHRGSGQENVFHRRRTRRTEMVMFAIAVTVCFSLVVQSILQALIMFNTGSVSPVRSTCQDLRAFAIDIAICGPTWILYYTTIYSHKSTVAANSAPQSRTH